MTVPVLDPDAAELLPFMGPDERKLLDALRATRATELTEAQNSKLAALIYGRPRAHVDYQRRPVDWIVEKLGVPRHTLDWELCYQINDIAEHAWDGNVANPLVRILEALADWKHVGVESATTTGKTFLAACVVLWFLACFENSLVLTVAPKEDQLTLLVWMEIGRLFPKFREHFPQAEKTHLRIRMVPGADDEDVWTAKGFVAGVKAEEIEGSATKAQGFHREHMLVLFEEMPGIHPAIVRAFFNTCRAPHNLMLGQGNPNHQLDQLHLFCTRPRVTHVRISALDHPNVVCDNASIIPGAVSRQGVEEAAAAEEDGVESRMYQSRVRGISPAEATDALIKWAWCEAAAALWEQEEARRKAGQPLLFRSGRRAKGVDVANSEAGDKAAIADGDGAFLESIRSFQCPDANLLGLQVYREMLGVLPGQPLPAERTYTVLPEHVGIDSIGVGAGTVNELARLMDGAYLVYAFVSGRTPYKNAEKAPDGTLFDWAPDAGQFENLRAQALWQLREDLRLGRLAIPRNPALWRQLTAFTYQPFPGKVVVESTKDIKKRIGRSPDDAMAVAIWNWVRPRAVPKAVTTEPMDDRRDPWAQRENLRPLDPEDEQYDPYGDGSSGSSTMSQLPWGY